MIETAPHNDLCTDYAGPVQRLLTIGETRSYDPAEWLDYAVEFGLGREHIAELSRLACDRALNYGDPDSREAWGPVHAWRALGQLQAEASVAPLLAFLKTAESDEAVTEELPKVFGMIGRPAIPRIERFLSDRSNPTFPVVTARSLMRCVRRSGGIRLISRSPVTKRMWRSRWVSGITVPRPHQFIKLCPPVGLHRRMLTVSSRTIVRCPNTARSVVTIHARAAAERNIRSAAYNSA